MTDYKNLKKFKKSQINGLTKAIASKRFGVGASDNISAWNSIFEFTESIGMEISYSYSYVHGERLDFLKPRKITKEQTEFGKFWLRDYFYKKDGKPRAGKRTEFVSSGILAIAKRVVRFEFVGIQVLASQGFYPVQAVPIYRAYDREGNFFDYSPVHWGEPIIHGSERRKS